VLAACLPVSDLFGGTDSVVHKVFDVMPGCCIASECLVEAHPNDSLPGAAGGPDKISAGASTLASRPSFDSTAASWMSPALNSNASASAKLPHCVSLVMSRGLDSAARPATSVSEDLSSSDLPVCVEPCKSTPCDGAVSRVFNLRMDGVPAAEISSFASKTFTGCAMKVCQF